MGLTGNICDVMAGLPVPRLRSMQGHAMSPVLLQAPLGAPKPPWEAQWDHIDLSPNIFG